MCISAGDMIKFWYREKTNEWFISKVSKDGFVLRSSSKTNTSLIINSIKTTEDIADKSNYAKESATIKIGREPEIEDYVDYWPLITEKINS